MYVTLLSETHLKPHERIFTPNYHVYRTDRFPGLKSGTAFHVSKGIPHNHVDLHPLVSTEDTGICVPIANSEVFLAVLYVHLCRAWSDADVINLLNFRNKSLLAGDLNTKNPVWNSQVSNHSVRNS
jgi:hypothetical protein